MVIFMVMRMRVITRDRVCICILGSLGMFRLDGGFWIIVFSPEN